MKNKKIYLVAAFAIIVMGGIPSVMSFAAKQTIDTARVELSEPMEIGAFMASIKKQNFDEMILESSFVFDGEEIYDFHIVRKNEQDRDITTDYINNRKALIADVKGITDLSAKDKGAMENVKIKKATFTGTKGNIDKLQKKLKIKKIDVADEAILKRPQPTRKKKLEEIKNFFVTPVEAASTQFFPMYQYLPTSGTSYVNNSSVLGERYTLQYMNWNNNYFMSDETYEHKFYLNNQDEKTFLNGDSTTYPGCFPTVTYAATTWGVCLTAIP